MSTRSSRVLGLLVAALLVGLLVLPEADAKGSRGGHRAARAPRVSAPHRMNRAPAPRAPKMPRAAAPARNNVAHANNAQVHKNNSAQAHAKNTQAHANSAQAHANSAQAHVNTATSSGTANRARTAQNPALASNSTTTRSPNSYTYGSGTNARHYRAYGYGRGYRNRYNGSGSGYGRSQANNRAIVSRLRSVHSGLTRIDHDYQGHRARAVHSVSMAIRQLSHRSMIYRNTGFASNMNLNNNNNNGRGLGNRQAGLGANTRRTQPLTQAQSDSRMSQHLRSLQGVQMQLTNQGTSTSGHSRARGHLQTAIRELNTALSIR